METRRPMRKLPKKQNFGNDGRAERVRQRKKKTGRGKSPLLRMVEEAVGETVRDNFLNIDGIWGWA